MTDIVFDIEADGFLEDAKVIHCISISEDGDDPLCYGPDQLDVALRRMRYAHNLIGHNIIRYDMPMLSKHLEFTPDPGVSIRDTYLLSRMAYPDIIRKDAAATKIPKQQWGSYSLRAFGHRLGMYKGDCEDFSEYTPDMAEYCNQDVRVTHQLWGMLKKKKMSDTAVRMETQFAQLAFKMEKHGIGFDSTAAVALYRSLGKRREEILSLIVDLVPPKIEEMRTPQYWLDPVTGVLYDKKKDAPSAIRRELTEGPVRVKEHKFNPMSRPQVAEFLITKGWEPTAKTPTGQVRIDEAILTHIDAIPEAALIAELYRIQKISGMLAEGKKAWLLLEERGRIHPRLHTLGAYSGRTSCVNPNLQQVPSSRLPFGEECRALFRAEPPNLLVGCDAKSLEVRCFAHYMTKFDDGEFADSVISGDIHSMNADMMSCDRQTAKNTFFALIYGASSGKIAKMLDIPGRKAAALVDGLFRERPAMRRLINKVKNRVAQTGSLTGLDGRTLKPRSPHAAVNLLIQSAGACVSKRAALNLEYTILANDWSDTHIVGFIHDEIIIETPDEVVRGVMDAAVRAFQDTTKQYNLRCPMDGEAQLGMNWSEIH